MNLPRTAYITLWFPKPSETFIFREATTLKAMGLPLQVFSLYAPLKRDLSPEMQAFSETRALGMLNTPGLLAMLLTQLATAPRSILSMFQDMPFNRWRSLEGLGENLWALCCGLYLAKTFREQRIEHIHAPWACGPATAAWAASQCTGIPFSFAGRAGDIYPPEGALPRKIADAAFVRVNYKGNTAYLKSLAPQHGQKIKLVYNPLSRGCPGMPRRAASPGFRLLAAGRFVSKKGFDVLLQACGILEEQGIDFSLTLAGDGALRGRLRRQAAGLGLKERVEFPGFLSHDALSSRMLENDALVVPSVVAPQGDRDGIPNVIMEAFAHGLPVVASDVAGIGEVVANGETGYLTQPGDPAALADSLARVAAHRDEALSLAEQGRKRILDMFDPQKNCRKLIELFAAHTARPAS